MEFSPILLTDVVYTKDEYKQIREYNRKQFAISPEAYCKKQVPYEPQYELSVDGTAYVMNNWLKGLSLIKKKYKRYVPKFSSFNSLFVCKTGLPVEIDYAVMIISRNNSTRHGYKYVSREACFECYLTESGHAEYIIYAGDKRKIREGYYGIY